MIQNNILPLSINVRLHAAAVLLKKYFEQKDRSPLSKQTKIKALLHGHTPELFSLYGLENKNENSSYYLSEYERRVAKLLNDDPSLLDNKNKFYSFMRSFGYEKYLPEVYGTLQDGTLLSDKYESLRDIVRQEGKCVVKQMSGGGGNEVYICTLQQDDVILQGKGSSEFTASSILDNFDGFLVTEYCEQASYIKKVNPGSANTIRAITISPSPDEAYLIAAAHRIGSSRSGVLDNFSQRGLSSYIDLETGILSKAAVRRSDHTLDWYTHHPESDARIEGVSVPGWAKIVREIESIAGEIEQFRYVGWDIIVTGQGEFSIIEGNSYPNPRVLQIHQPLLTDHRTSAFFRSKDGRVAKSSRVQ